MNNRDVLRIILDNMIQNNNILTGKTLLVCTLVDKWFHTFCRAKLDYLYVKTTYADGVSSRQFAFFTIDYIQQRMAYLPLTLRHLVTTMTNVKQRLGDGYNICLSLEYGCCGVDLNTPDGRFCRFSFNDGAIETSIQRQCIVNFASFNDDMLDTNLLVLNEYICDTFKYRELYVTILYQAYDGKDVQPTILEYQVICECFAAATGTKMTWDDYYMWREPLTHFQEWIINNRHRFRTQSNIKFVIDMVLESQVFPQSDPYEMVSYIQWIGGDLQKVKRFLIIYGVYEIEMFGTTNVKNIVLCVACNSFFNKLWSDYRGYCEVCACKDEDNIVFAKKQKY
jgi:hypothetical protein